MSWIVPRLEATTALSTLASREVVLLGKTWRGYFSEIRLYNVCLAPNTREREISMYLSWKELSPSSIKGPCVDDVFLCEDRDRYGFSMLCVSMARIDFVFLLPLSLSYAPPLSTILRAESSFPRGGPCVFWGGYERLAAAPVISLEKWGRGWWRRRRKKREGRRRHICGCLSSFFRTGRRSVKMCL